jgi:uncharacterized protein (DUF983 family)
MLLLAKRIKAILLQRCPRCLRGNVFSGPATMRECCPECGHKFEREPGYFTGAMYASYFLAIPVLGLITLLIYSLFLRSWSLENVVLVAALPFLFLVPLVFRYSRVVWMHIDHPP